MSHGTFFFRLPLSRLADPGPDAAWNPRGLATLPPLAGNVGNAAVLARRDRRVMSHPTVKAVAPKKKNAPIPFPSRAPTLVYWGLEKIEKKVTMPVMAAATHAPLYFR